MDKEAAAANDVTLLNTTAPPNVMSLLNVVSPATVTSPTGDTVIRALSEPSLIVTVPDLLAAEPAPALMTMSPPVDTPTPPEIVRSPPTEVDPVACPPVTDTPPAVVESAVDMPPTMVTSCPFRFVLPAEMATLPAEVVSSDASVSVVRACRVTVLAVDCTSMVPEDCKVAVPLDVMLSAPDVEVTVVLTPDVVSEPSAFTWRRVTPL
mmetsp:Transcript_117129/g.325654  ORF Transcript_117129/g.325654 Transcript_117129/m.325654 type:complete len:208 (-) Transcript_117129:743-1366(-)